MAGALIFTLILFPGISQAQEVILVPWGESIQEAINAAADGDKILVYPGLYVENIDFLGKAITVEGGAGPGMTIIDGGLVSPVVIFNSGEPSDAILDGFTIQNGFGYYGGGIHISNSSPTIQNCVVTRNEAGAWGGGIYLEDSESLIYNCQVLVNWAHSMWGGIGIKGEASPIISSCEISGNGSNMGGGIGCGVGSDPAIQECSIYENVAQDGGGGIDCSDADPWIVNCMITDNSAGSNGGGIRCVTSDLILQNCVISNNQAYEGGGIYVASNTDLQVTYCTLTDNIAEEQGGGIYCYSLVPPDSPTVTNSILWGNLALEGSQIWMGNSIFPSTLTVRYSDVQGGEDEVYLDDPSCILDWGSGNIDADPLFGEYGYNLTVDSPCIDAGMDAGVYTDLDGDPRPIGPGFDMGMDEYDTGYRILLNPFYIVGTGTLRINFTIGTPEPALWVAGLVYIEPALQVTTLWSIDVPVIDPPYSNVISFPLKPEGWVGVFMILRTAEEGLQEFKLVWVYTGE